MAHAEQSGLIPCVLFLGLHNDKVCFSWLFPLVVALVPLVLLVPLVPLVLLAPLILLVCLVLLFSWFS